MRGSYLVSLVLAGGCAIHGGIRTEQVGTGHGTVTTRGAGASEVSAAPGGGGMPLPRGTYDFELRIGVPRAQLVDWKVTCTGVEERQGQVGQAFEHYKEHRLAQLTREREQQAKIYARAVTQPPPNVVVVARPPVARVVTPIGRVDVQPVVVREPSAQVNVDVEVPPVTELPPGDHGQGTFPARVRVVMPADGVCAITALADDPGVNAFYSVTRQRDLGVEAAERKQVVYVGAVTMRGRLTERLVAYGADPLAKQRRLDAEARARADAEARRGAELARQREVELRVDEERRLQREAERSQREAAEAAKRREREVELRERWLLEQEQAERAQELAYAVAWEAEAPARAAADLLIYQKEVSIRWRLTLIAWLVTHGHADPDRRGRIARARAQREQELQAGLRIKLEIERTERERLIRIRMEQDRKELERQREADRIAREERARTQRLQEQREQEQRAERENREAIERARRERAATELAELELRRAHAATRIRQTVVGTLIGYGAKLRPPMPELRIENPGPAPFDGAQWAAGRWEWNSLRTEWQWRGGGWRDTTRFGRTGGEAVVTNTVVVEPAPTVVVEPPVVTTVVSTPVVVTPAVVIEVGRPGYQPRPSYQRPRPTARPYQPRPSAQRPAPRRPAPAQAPQSDDDKRRR